MRRIFCRNAMSVAVLALVAVSVAGCGGNSKSSTPPTVPALTVTAAGTTTAPAPTTAPATTTTTPATTATAPATTTPSSGSTGTSSVPASCLDFAGAASKVSQAFNPTGVTGLDTAKLKAYYLALADKAPASIKASFVVVANVLVTYLDQIKGLNFKPGQTPSADAIQKLQKAAAALQTSNFRQATVKIQAWVKSGCH
jgi:hypothetical protein